MPVLSRRTTRAIVLTLALGSSTGLFVPLEAQSAVRGTVRAAGSSRLIAAAEISIDGVGAQPAHTNPRGEFILGGLPAGAIVIRFRAVGYQPLEAKAELSGTDTLQVDVQLDATPQALEPIVVAGTKKVRPQQNRITLAEIETVVGSSSDGYDVVQQLRPAYLRGRGASNLGDPNHPTVYPMGVDSTKPMNPMQARQSAELTAAARLPRQRLPRVVIDDGPLEDLDGLRRVVPTTIKEIRLMSSIDAAIRWGTGADGGVILVVLK